MPIAQPPKSRQWRRRSVNILIIMISMTFIVTSVTLLGHLPDVFEPPSGTSTENEMLHVVPSEYKPIAKASSSGSLLISDTRDTNKAKRHFLFFHVSIPTWDFKGSDTRLMHIFEAVLAEGHTLDVVSWEQGYSRPYHTETLHQMGIGTYSLMDPDELVNVLRKRGADIAVFALFNRHRYWDWLDACVLRIKSLSPETSIVVLSDDNHWLRELNLAQKSTHWEDIKEREADVYFSVDFVAGITERDQLLHQSLAPLTSTGILRYVAEEAIVKSPLPWNERSGLLFIGNDNVVNRLSLDWFVEHVWPQVRKDIGDIELHISGTVVCGKCRDKKDVIQHGKLSQNAIVELMEKTRVFISPIVDGTGLNTKNILALSNGIPLITTSIGTQGMYLGSANSDVCMVCGVDDRKCFKDAVVDSYTDMYKWERMVKVGREHILDVFSFQSLCDDVQYMVNTLNKPIVEKVDKQIPKETYFLTATFYNNEESFPTFFMRMLELIEDLGRENVFVSLYESGSTDDTPVLIEAARIILETRRIANSVVAERNVDRKMYFGNRPAYLADVRNLAMKPLTGKYSRVIAFNDIIFNPKDVVSLAHTPVDYDMVCSMDFSYASWQIYSDLHIDDKGTTGLRFYDTWVTRDLRGSLMTSRPPYVLEPRSQALMAKGQPVPVYSCWNGVVVFKSDPWVKHGLRFRAATDGECSSSECYLWGHDMWSAGFNRIFINPQVRVAYDTSVFKAAQKLPFEEIAHPPAPLSDSEIAFLKEPRSRPDKIVCCGTAFGLDVADWDSCQWQHTLPQSDGHDVITVVFEGQIFETHSYSVVNRQLVKRMSRDPHINLIVVALPSDEKFAAESDFSEAEVLMSIIPSNVLPMNANVLIRNHWPPNWARPQWCGDECRLVLMQPWEFGHIPQDWLNAMHEVSKIVVPSRYVKQMYLRSGVPESKVAVVPHGVELDKFTPHNTPYEGIPQDTTFKFLFHGGLLPRKGVDVLLKAFMKAFRPLEDVSLVLHTTYVHATEEYVNLVEDLVATAIMKGYRIQWLKGTTIPESELGRLYTAVDAFVLPYRSEGFGLPIVEAMASQLPVIVTIGGASDDYVTKTSGYLIESEEVVCNTWPCSEDAKSLCAFCDVECICKELVEDAYWLEPSVDDLSVKMRSVMDDELDRQTKATNARMDAAKMNWDSVYTEFKNHAVGNKTKQRMVQEFGSY